MISIHTATALACSWLDLDLKFGTPQCQEGSGCYEVPQMSAVNVFKM